MWWKNFSRPGGVAAAIVLLFLFLGDALPASAQAIKGEIISVGIGGTNGASGIYRTGSWVPVQVRLQNLTPSPIVARLAVQSNALNDLDGDRVTSNGPAFTLAASPEPRTLWTYYWPGPDDQTETGARGITSLLVLEGEKGDRILGEVTTPDRQARATGLSRTDENRGDSTGRSTRFVVVLGKNLAGWNTFLRSWGGTEAVALAQVSQSANLPDDVKGFDPIDVIVWEADTVKASEIPQEFQLKAMLDWVRAGGHLIISVGSKWQELQKTENTALQTALPLTMKSSRPVQWNDVRLANSEWAGPAGTGSDTMANKSFEQVVGDLRPGARAVLAPKTPAFAGAPLVVTGLYGQGAVTLVTFDVTNADLATALSSNEKYWAQFWTQAAGWLWPQDFKTAQQYKDDQQRGNTQISTSPGALKLGDTIPVAVDVTEATEVRILVAILFLGIYWLLAGPIGHLILRMYHVVHWSWWVFGGTVLLATAVASGVVSLLHIQSAELRHKSYVLGRVNSPDASVVSYYGVYAPASGSVELKQPDGTGMSYLVPMCFPISGEIKAYADPQGYQIWDEHPSTVAPVFRNTLKKMQGRWSGQLAGITGTAAYTADPFHILAGTLTNNSDFDLDNVNIVVYRPMLTYQSDTLAKYGYAYRPGDSYLYHVGNWKKGAALNLSQAMNLDMFGASRNADASQDLREDDWGARFGQMLQKYVRAQVSGKFTYNSGAVWETPETSLFDGSLPPTDKLIDEDLLGVLLDLRGLDPLSKSGRTEVVRGPGRLIDCTKELHAAGALIIAHSDRNTKVKAPVPLTLNGSQLTSKGEVTFVWALPVSGEMPASMLFPPPAASGPMSIGTGRGNIAPELEKP